MPASNSSPHPCVSAGFGEPEGVSGLVASRCYLKKKAVAGGDLADKGANLAVVLT